MSEHAHGGGEHDVNTDAGFNAFLAAQAGTDGDPDVQDALSRIGEGETSVQSGIAQGQTVEESPGERPRDPDTGRFLPKDAVPDPVEAGTPEAPPADTGQPETDSAVLQKQLADKDAFIGKQSNEIGELRERVARMEGRLERPEPQQQREPLPSGDTEDVLTDMIQQRGGPDTMEWVLKNQPHLFDVARRVYAEEDPVDYPVWAGLYGASLATPSQPEPQAPDPDLQAVAIRERYTQVLSQIPDEDKSVLAENFEVVTKSAPKFVMDAFVGSDPSDRLDAVRYMVSMARSAQAARTPSVEVKEAAVAAKQATAVATGSQRPVAPGNAGGADNVYGVDLETLSPEERTKAITSAFHKQLFETETSSVMDGLAQGRETP